MDKDINRVLFAKKIQRLNKTLIINRFLFAKKIPSNKSI